jgi:hypothetical protein
VAEDKRWLACDDNMEDLEKGLLRRHYYLEPEQPPSRVDVKILPEQHLSSTQSFINYNSDGIRTNT